MGEDITVCSQGAVELRLNEDREPVGGQLEHVSALLIVRPI